MRLSHLVAGAFALVAVACSSPVVPEDPCASLTCPVVEHGTNTCQNGACVVACTAPFVAANDAKSCASPNTVEACGPAAQACPTDPNGSTSCVSGECVLTCNAPRVLIGASCESPNSAAACGPELTVCPIDPNGEATCVEGECVLTCTTPRVIDASGTACVSPNTVTACGPELTACPVDVNGEATCEEGECVLTCTAPRVLDASGVACVSPNTVAACGPALAVCPTDPNGETTCEEGECLLTCTAPRVIEGSACVSPNTVAACGPALIACPTVPNGETTCEEGECVLTCTAPRILDEANAACVPPNTVDACGEDLEVCAEDEFGTPTCSAQGECGIDCRPETAPVDGVCQPLHDSCFALREAGFTTDGEYAIRDRDGERQIIICDMTTDGGGWMLVRQGDVRTTTTLTSATVSRDASGGAKVQLMANDGVECGKQAGDTTFVAENLAWNQLRYTQTFSNKADCWSIFGDESIASSLESGNLVPFDADIDLIRNESLMGSSGQDAFEGALSVCSDDPVFWHAMGTTRSAELIQRRSDAEGSAGPSTRVSCFPDHEKPSWTYENLSVRNCPMTLDHCGPECASCEVPENASGACTDGACEDWTCNPGYRRDKEGTRCIEDCLEMLNLPFCTASGADICLAHRWAFDADSPTADLAGDITGAITGAVMPGPGLTGHALWFLGRDDSLFNVDAAAGSFGTADFSMAFWMKSTPPMQTAELGGNRVSSSNGMFLSLRQRSDGTLSAELDQGTPGTYVGVTSQQSLSDDAWHHVVVVREGLVLRIYADGVLEQAQSATVLANLTTNVELRFGGSHIGLNAYYGLLEDLRIYQGALAAARVAALAAPVCE